jgi:hypothetical protein
MFRTAIACALAIAAVSAGCGFDTNTGIMRAAPGDPVGSANTGTGSVTVNSTIPPEAKSAGIGIGP